MTRALRTPHSSEPLGDLSAQPESPIGRAVSELFYEFLEEFLAVTAYRECKRSGPPSRVAGGGAVL